MAEKKNHHFVPQSYQRLFSNDGKSIGVYNIKKNLLINQSSIKNTMSKDYFYSKNQNVEDALAEIERLCMLTFHKLDNNNDYNLHEVERLNILTYVMMQLGRTVYMSERLSDDVNEMSLEIFKAHPTFRVMRQSCSAYSLSLKYLSSLKPYALRFITFILLFIPSTLAVEI